MSSIHALRLVLVALIATVAVLMIMAALAVDGGPGPTDIPTPYPTPCHPCGGPPGG